MSKVYIPDADVAASGWLRWPEECLWIKYPRHTSLLPHPALEQLYNGSRSPTTETEKLLVANREWLQTFIDHILGQCIVSIPAGGPLPLQKGI